VSEDTNATSKRGFAFLYYAGKLKQDIMEGLDWSTRPSPALLSTRSSSHSF
jgi:hypothetical protein